MIIIKTLVSLLFLQLIQFENLRAQSAEDIILIYFKIVDKETRRPIEGANVLVKSKYFFDYSDYLGETEATTDEDGWAITGFRMMPSQEGDRGILEISSNGYHYIELYFNLLDMSFLKKYERFSGMRILEEFRQYSGEEYEVADGNDFLGIKLEVPMERVILRNGIDNMRPEVTTIKKVIKHADKIDDRKLVFNRTIEVSDMTINKETDCMTIIDLNNELGNDCIEISVGWREWGIDAIYWNICSERKSIIELDTRDYNSFDTEGQLVKSSHYPFETEVRTSSLRTKKVKVPYDSNPELFFKKVTFQLKIYSRASSKVDLIETGCVKIK